VSRSDAPRSEDIVQEREALQELVQTNGWRLFVLRALREHEGVGYVARMGTALTGNDPLAPKVVHQTSLELKRLLQWPEQRLAELNGER
jgi:hypothetical protein